MALPALLRKLFKSSGYGSELNDGIVSKTISNQDWSNAYNYPVGAIARGSNGVLYYSAAQSGPGTSAGAKNPVSAGASYWVSLDVAAFESNISSALNDKVSTSTYNSGLATRVALDGSNKSSIGYALAQYMSHTAMPSAMWINVSLPSNGEKATAPADGFFVLGGRTTSGYYAFVQLMCDTGYNVSNKVTVQSNDSGIFTFVPVSKSMEIQVNYSSNIANLYLTFVYANSYV